MSLAPGAPTAADDVLDAVDAVAPLAAGKAASTTRNNTTTLAADPDLALSVLANTVYRLEAFVIFTSGTVPDFKLDISGPASHVLEANATTFDASDAAAAQGTDERMLTTGGNIGLPGAGTTYSTQRQQLHLVGMVTTAGTAGTVAVRWAQNTLEASNTVVYAGSWLQLTPMS